MFEFLSKYVVCFLTDDDLTNCVRLWKNDMKFTTINIIYFEHQQRNQISSKYILLIIDFKFYEIRIHTFFYLHIIKEMRLLNYIKSKRTLKKQCVI